MFLACFVDANQQNSARFNFEQLFFAQRWQQRREETAVLGWLDQAA